jgi:Flp pilus assembly protein TadD
MHNSTSCKRVVGALLALVFGGCAGTPPLRQSWVRIRTDHYEILSVLGAERTLEHARELELFRSVVHSLTTLNEFEAPVPTRIFILDERAWKSLGDPRLAGAFSQGLRENTLTLNVDSGIEGRETLYHEYTHYLMSGQDWSSYPLWLEEGWAELLSTMRVDGDRIVVGEVPVKSVPDVVVVGPGVDLKNLTPEDFRAQALAVDVGEVIRTHDYPGGGLSAKRFYWGSFLLLHYLQFGRDSKSSFGVQMSRFIASLAAGEMESVAFERAFGVNTEAMTEEIRQYVRRSHLPGLVIPADRFKASSQDPRTDSPSIGEMGSELGWLLVSSGRPSEAEAYFRAAVEADPELPRAHCGLGTAASQRGDWKEASRHLDRCLALAPNEALSHLDMANHLIALAEANSDEWDRVASSVRSHLDRCLEIAPGMSEAQLALGKSILIRGGDPIEAVKAVERGAVQFPRDPGVRLLLAKAYAGAGRKDDAIASLRSIAAFTHGQVAEDARLMLAELSDEGKPSFPTNLDISYEEAEARAAVHSRHYYHAYARAAQEELARVYWTHLYGCRVNEPFGVVVAIGSAGFLDEIYVQTESKASRCVKRMLRQNHIQLPQPPVSPFFQRVRESAGASPRAEDPFRGRQHASTHNLTPPNPDNPLISVRINQMYRVGG